MNRKGCIVSLLQLILQMLGIKSTPTAVTQDVHYRRVMDKWVAQLLSDWLHDIDSNIDQKRAFAVLTGNGADYEETAELIRSALLDANVTFAQQGNQYTIEVQAYINELNIADAAPTVLRKRAQRTVQWHEIPDDIRGRLIKEREPITLTYSVPG